jgi:acyl-coenzyme A synthetase/AMP-(fatty) acid ligase
MIKKRGYRIELGEIETALDRHDDVERAAVVASSSGETGVAVSAFVAMRPGRKGSIIAMKRHCTTYLPHYMIPDRIAFVSELPTTSTDKIDYQKLKSMVTCS